MRSLRKPAAVAMRGGGRACPRRLRRQQRRQHASSSNGKVTLTWWTNATAGQLKTVWQQAATAFHTAHPNVTIQVEPLQNEAFTTKIPPALASSNPPDIYQQWGGGQLATQVPSGKVTDLTKLQLGLDRPGWLGRPGLAGRRQAVRHPLRPAHGRLLVPQGPVRAGRDHHPADHPGRSSSPTTPS